MMREEGDDWRSFEGGQRWRCRGPGYLCEVGTAGHVPSLLNTHGTATVLRRIRTIYEGRLRIGALDLCGTGVDILVANAMTESFGSVPTPVDAAQLCAMIDSNPGLPLDSRLDSMLRQLKATPATKWQVRFEPGYTGPITTPSKISTGAHQMLVSTAASLPSVKGHYKSPAEMVREECIRMLSDSLHAAQLAVEYLNRAQGQHHNQLPLIAATYNAGRPRFTQCNPWHLVQYGEHIDRWLGYYNASRQLSDAHPPIVNPTEMPSALPRAMTESPKGAAATLGGRLSPHFSVDELTASPTARVRHIDNGAPPDVVENLRKLAALLEAVRDILGARPLHINSGYRSPALNAAVRGKLTSAHCFGLAADFTCATFGPPLAICRAIETSSLQYDQLIHEFGTWVHIGLARPGKPQRRESLTIDKAGTRKGLHAI